MDNGVAYTNLDKSVLTLTTLKSFQSTAAHSTMGTDHNGLSA